MRDPVRRNRVAAWATERRRVGFEVAQGVGGAHAELREPGVVEGEPPAHGDDRDAVRARPAGHPRHGLAREGLLVERALAGDDQVGAPGTGARRAGRGLRQRVVEADEVEHDVHSRTAFGAEHGEQCEPHAAGGPRPGRLDPPVDHVGRLAGTAREGGGHDRRPNGSGRPRAGRRRRAWRPSAGRTPPRLRTGRAGGCRRRRRAPGGWRPAVGRARTGRAGPGRPAPRRRRAGRAPRRRAAALRGRRASPRRRRCWPTRPPR